MTTPFTTQTLSKMVIALADGSAGASIILGDLIGAVRKLDRREPIPRYPEYLDSLNDLDLRGARIWYLFHGVCSEDMETMVGLLQAVILGVVARDELRIAVQQAMAGQAPTLDIPLALTKVKELLPSFGS